MVSYQALYCHSHYLSQFLRFSVLQPFYVELYSISFDQKIHCISADINITTYEKEGIFNPEGDLRLQRNLFSGFDLYKSGHGLGSKRNNLKQHIALLKVYEKYHIEDSLYFSRKDVHGGMNIVSFVFENRLSEQMLFFNEIARTANLILDNVSAIIQQSKRISFKGNISPQSETTLTPKEIHALQLLCQGRNNKTIATIMNISERTVSKHIENIHSKLSTHSKLELIARLNNNIALN